jgi:hypothetical protein
MNVLLQMHEYYEYKQSLRLICLPALGTDIVVALLTAEIIGTADGILASTAIPGHFSHPQVLHGVSLGAAESVVSDRPRVPCRWRLNAAHDIICDDGK